MDYNTIEDIEKAFPDDTTARKYLSALRWGNWANCPYCGNSKAYFIETGKRYKCANKDCYKKFSVTVGSMLEASNLPINKIIKGVFLYAKTRGRCLCSDMISTCEISNKSEFFLRDKCDYIWPHVIRDGKTAKEITEQMFGLFVSLYESFVYLKSLPFYRNPFHIAESEINNISDSKQYSILLRYTKYFINVWTRKKKKFVWIDFISAEELLSEVFLDMSITGVKEYNTTYVLKAIWRIHMRMWVKFLKEHPKHNEFLQKKRREYSRKNKLNLTDRYIIDAIKSSKEGDGMSWQQIKENKSLIEKRREQIKKHRNKNGLVYDFHSHFN